MVYPVNMNMTPRQTKMLIALWCLGVLLGSSTSIATWTLSSDGWIQGTSNFFYLLALPGWIPLYILGFSGMRTDPVAIVVANAIAWTAWCLLIAICAQIASRDHSESSESHQPLPDQSRRSFLAKGLLGAGAVGAVVSPGYATLIEPWSLKVRRYTLPIRALPESLEGMRIVQFSDPHLGPRVPSSFYSHAVQVVADLRPDLLLLTGDYVHDGTDQIDEAARLCRPMIEAARIGAVGVLGNHDWWGDGPRMSQALRDQGVIMIDNDRVWLDPQTQRLTSSRTTGAMAIVGLGDLTEDTLDFSKAFQAVDDEYPCLVLAHQPDTAEISVFTTPHAPRVDAMFSGHTHGGQVRIPLIGTPLVPSDYGSKYAGGVIQGPAFPVVVSRGVGMSLLPVRFGVPPEIVEVTLTRA